MESFIFRIQNLDFYYQKLEINSKTKIKSTIPDLYLDDDMDEEKMARDDLTKANIFSLKYF